MKAQLCLVTENVINARKRFFVPVNQRPYSWTDKEVGELIDDIWQSAKAGDKEYFIGSIFCIEPKAENQRYEIVDGQQRLITLTLILLELSERQKQIMGKESSGAQKLRNMVVQEDDIGGNTTRTLTLFVREEEKDFYQRCIIEQEEVNRRPKLTSEEKTFNSNRETVREKLTDLEDQEVEKFTRHLLDKVKVVFVETDDRSLSYHLFNVLNNRGLPLNDSDLIKNELLFAARCKDEGSDKKIEENWRQMERLVGGDKLDDFFTLQIISEKTDRDRAKGRSRYVYFEGKLKRDPVKISDSLLHSANDRNIFREGKYSSETSIRFLKLLAKPSDWEPAFIAFLRKDGLRDRFLDFARLFEKAYMHYHLSSELYRQRDAVCYHSVEAINIGETFDKIMERIASLGDNRKLGEALDAERFYDLDRRSTFNTVKTVLLRLENSRHDASSDRTYNLRGLTVEHVLPQNMNNRYWTDRFSKDEHTKWCHRLGNLTLLLGTKNSMAGNLDFVQKKNAYQKAKKKPLEITNELCDLSEWNFCALETRHKNLKQELFDLWKITSEDSRKDLLSG